MTDYLQSLFHHPLRKNFWLSLYSFFISFCMISGRSYQQLSSWDYLFGSFFQACASILAIAGYYFLIKYSMIFFYDIFHKRNFLRTFCKNGAESFLFEKRPFLSSLLIISVCYLPVFICFFPGTLHWDGHAQLWNYLGAVEWTGHYPPISTFFMGISLQIGRRLFHSDSYGLFLFTGPQFFIQILIFSYAVSVVCKAKAPIILRWFSLLYFCFFPLFPIWGYTVNKDTYYYLFVFLFIILTVDVHLTPDAHILWWQYLLFIVSAAGMTLFRNNGLHLIVFTFIFALLMLRKNRKIYFLALICSFLITAFTNHVFMPHYGIEKGAVREALSVPLQQTARYLAMHGDEVPEEELEILSSSFTELLINVPYLYNPEVSDDVKGLFLPEPSSEELKNYFSVWGKELLRHPDTYIQAFLNQNYGYFYPGRESFHEPYATYYLGNKQHWTDNYLDVAFSMESPRLRQLIENYNVLFSKAPVIGLLYRTGFHNYILIGCMVYLISRKKGRCLFPLIPCVGTVLICLLSPVNAYIRYMLPVMVSLPVYLAWCYFVTRRTSD